MSRMAFLSILCLLVHPAFSESYSPDAVITELSVGTGYARVKLSTMIPAEGCSNQTWYRLPSISGEGKEMYAAILSAKASGQIVRLQLVDCDNTNPKITHVYILP